MGHRRQGKQPLKLSSTYSSAEVAELATSFCIPVELATALCMLLVVLALPVRDTTAVTR